ncbi:MAG: hypothetical protein K0R27_2004 [Xanthobacteraceae bacterium]|jgi:uncharacterized protein (TIGR02186 family)|nr:hypothetical protein [Xanthobacteraceae bacterium]
MRLVALIALLLAAGPARAEELVLSLSKPRVTITSSFAGEPIALFGVIERDGMASPDHPYDVVVTVRGPKARFVTWRKQRVLGLWMNTESRTFLAAPSYLAVLSNREPALMAPPDVLRQEQAGFANNHLLQRLATDYADVVQDDPFRQAFLRVKQAQGLYYERPTGVEFIAPRVFRSTIPIPGTAPVGTYDVVVKIFAGGEMVKQGTTTLEVAKVDFEQTVATAARDHAWLYGLVTALGALAVGFVANVAFRRD